jgi:hypothetical protein
MLMSLPTRAFALINTTYDVTKCLGSSQTVNSSSSLKRTTGSIQNISGSQVTLFCPIVKTTSGPGISTDEIWDATVPATATNGATVSCGIEVFQSQFFDDGTNFVESNWSSVTGSGTITIGFESEFGSPQDFWDGSGIPGAWYYADISCLLPAGTSIQNYTVSESGTPQNNRIYTTSSCAPDAGDTDFWRYLDPENGSDVAGGTIQSSAQTSTKFIFDCLVPSKIPSNSAGSSVEFTLGPDEGSGTFGCSLDKSKTPQTWPTMTVPSNTGVVQVIPLSGQPLLRFPAGQSHTLVCDEQPDASDGDPSIHTFRTEADWTPTASNAGNGYPTANAIDLNTGSRWSTGTPQVSGMWFKLDLQSEKTFSSIKMDSTGSNDDYAHGYQVFVSNNNASWGSAIASGAGTGPVITVHFPTQNARYLKVVQTGADSHWWSIYEFTVFK